MRKRTMGTGRSAGVWLVCTAAAGAVLLARFGVLSHAYRPGKGKDPGDDCLMATCLSSSVAEQQAQLPWLRQFFFARDGSADLVRIAPDSRLAEMQWLFPVGLALMVLGLAGLITLTLRSRNEAVAFGFVTGARIGQLQHAGWAVALGGSWALSPSIGLYLGLGYWEAAMGYGGCVLVGALGLVLWVESHPPGFGPVWGLRRLGLNLAAATTAAALISIIGLKLFPLLVILFAFPPFMASIPVFLVAGTIAWKYRARDTARLLADPGEAPDPARPDRS